MSGGGGPPPRPPPTTVFQPKRKHSRHVREHSRTLSRYLDCLPAPVDPFSVLTKLHARVLF